MARLPLTPTMLIRVYEWLRVTSPYRAWKLPDADEIEFFVTLHRDRCAHYRGLDHTKPGRATHVEIAASMNTIWNYYHLHQTMAHEMIHMHLDRIGKDDGHGPNFAKCAKRVCRYHGFEVQDFLE